MNTSTICLNMIVRDEAQVIRRCLESVRPFIDSWVIVDTGSTDGTQDLIRALYADIPGELHERPWRNFGHNRNEALALARGKADYLLFIDADETLRAPAGYQWPRLTHPAYFLHAEYAGTTYSRGTIVATRLDWRWTGVIHEFLESTPAVSFEQLDWPRIVVEHDGARARDPVTYAKDAALLERALPDEPQNARYSFYLAQSYRDAGQLDRARDAYRRRAAMGGWDEEVWYSLYEIGSLAARLFARQAAAIARPPDVLFVDDAVYLWRSLDEFGVAAYWAGALEEGRAATERLLASPHLPPSERPRIEENLRHYRRSAGPAPTS